jgi:hypothetical protein
LDEIFEYYRKANFLLQYDCHRSLGLGNRPDSTRHWRLSDRRYSLKFKSSSKKPISTIPITNTIPKSLIRRNLITGAMLSLRRSCDRSLSARLSLDQTEHPALCRASSRRYASLGLRSKIAGRCSLGVIATETVDSPHRCVER